MKTGKVIIALVILSFAAGLFGGYRIWGIKDEGKTDIKQLLKKLNEEVELLEKKNKDLLASIEASKADIDASAAMKKEIQEVKTQLQNALQEKEGFERSLAEVRAKEELDAEKQGEAQNELRTLHDDLKGRITTLESRNQVLTDQLQKTQRENAEKEALLAQVRGELSEARQKASREENLKALSDDLKGRISALEKENQELKSVIDNISEMTRRKEETQ